MQKLLKEKSEKTGKYAKNCQNSLKNSDGLEKP